MTVRLVVGHSIEQLPRLAAGVAQTCVTSPPYWGLRDYNLPPLVFDGAPSCEHHWGEKGSRHKGGPAGAGGATRRRSATKARNEVADVPTGAFCQRCGAWRGQLGLEPTPELYVQHMVQVFRGVWHALKDDGTLWLNLGDCYATGGGRVGGAPGGGAQGARWAGENSTHDLRKASRPESNGRGERQADPKATKGIGPMTQPNRMPIPGLKPKDLVMIPARVALALQADGWWVRMDNVWSKPNPMPESVTDRPTKSHEYVFLLSKSEHYYYDANAIAEPLSDGSMERLAQDVDAQEGSDRAHAGGKVNGKMKAVVRGSGNKARKQRTEHGGVEGSPSNQAFAIPWNSDGSHRPQYQRALELAKEGGLTEAHFEAIRSCGFFGDSETKTRITQNGTTNPEMLALAAEAKQVLGGYYREFLQRPVRNARSVWTITTKPFKGAHYATMPPELAEKCILAGSRPGDTVLDPFGGAGTTGLVADRLGRDAILIELSPTNIEMSRERISGDSPLFAEVTSE